MTARSHRLPYRFILSMHSVLPFPGLALLYVKRFRAWVLLARQRHRTRQQLAQLDDRALQDIGIFRADALHELQKPFWRE